MRHFTLATLTICAALLSAAPVPAQQPAAPPVRPVALPYGMPITLEQAKKVATAADAEARKLNVTAAIAVVEPTGVLVYYQKADGTQYVGAEISIAKARTAAKYRRNTKFFQESVNTGNPYYLSFPDMLAGEGGVLLVENGKIIGAIGISGAAAAIDGQIAQAGADVIK